MTRSIILHQNIPNNWSEREKLREKGQFWTPDWVAKAMVNYVIEDSKLVFDPAFGRGAFYSAFKTIKLSGERNIGFYGTDIDSQLVEEARNKYLDDKSFSIEQRDFIIAPPQRLFKSIVANPPYIRHHRLSEQVKRIAKEISFNALGKTIDGRAGIHVYFLIQALRLLEIDGKLAFIMPADTCEGIFSNQLWQWITNNYCLECVMTFKPEATPFPNVDTNAIILLIKNAQPTNRILWVEVNQPDTEDLSTLILSRFSVRNLPSLRVIGRDLKEALTTGLSRDPEQAIDSRFTLIQFATVMRGIATGANDFFFMTKEEANKRNIPPEFLKLAIGRTRDIDGFYVTEETINSLDIKGRPSLLFAPDGRNLEDFPIPVQKYLREGEKRRLPEKSLISSRNPWYKMEQRTPPPFLFAYLGRRNARFIRNLADVVPLTGFLCVYPHSSDPGYVDKLWSILQDSETIRNLNLVAKSYGSGAIKIEPRALERLPIPQNLLSEFNGAMRIGSRI